MPIQWHWRTKNLFENRLQSPGQVRKVRIRCFGATRQREIRKFCNVLIFRDKTGSVKLASTSTEAKNRLTLTLGCVEYAPTRRQGRKAAIESSLKIDQAICVGARLDSDDNVIHCFDSELKISRMSVQHCHYSLNRQAVL